MADIRKRKYNYSHAGQIGTLLTKLGLPTKTWGFWNKDRNELEWLFADARKIYKEKLIKLHPDRTGDTQSAADLGQLWGRIEKMFKRNLNRVAFSN